MSEREQRESYVLRDVGILPDPQIVERDGAMGENEKLSILRILEPQGAPDVIECDGAAYPRIFLACEYVPEVFDTEWDEEDRELRIGRPSEDCTAFMCSECGNSMMFDWTGEYSWFEPEHPYKPIGLRFCPRCGAKVLFPPSWISKREVVE